MKIPKLTLGLFHGIVSGASLIFGGVLGLSLVSVLEGLVFPVTTDWAPVSVHTEGQDLVVSGTMIKHRDCEYIPPPRARHTDTNKQFQVHSRAPTFGQSWASDRDPQPFGPWVISGAAGQPVEFYVVYRCHPLWLSPVVLGVIGADLKVQ